MSRKIFLDTNILADIVFNREFKSKVLESIKENDLLCISILSVINICFFAKK